MTRDEWMTYITQTYDAISDRPWARYPEHIVYRHTDNHKWFALFMTIPRRYLGQDSNQPIHIVNLKCDPVMIASLLREDGLYPAYHMSKTNWITVALDGRAAEDRIRMLIDLSYQATATHHRP